MNLGSSGWGILLCRLCYYINRRKLDVWLLFDYIAPSVHLVGVMLLGETFAKVFAKLREYEGA